MTTHIVKQGECLSLIAEHYGFRDWKTIYEHGANSQFRQLRPNPNVIYPGDEIAIPDKREKKESRAIDQKHRFEVPRRKWSFRLDFVDEEFEPLAEIPFRAFVDGTLVKEGRTDGDGGFEFEVGASSLRSHIELMDHRFELRLSELDPISRITGVQQRLNNLGYASGPVDGIVGPLTTRAVQAFRAAHPDLSTGEEINDDTRRVLLQLHDNDSNLPSQEEDMSWQYSPPPDTSDVVEPMEEPQLNSGDVDIDPVSED